jgi:hypothetical protein
MKTRYHDGSAARDGLCKTLAKLRIETDQRRDHLVVVRSSLADAAGNLLLAQESRVHCWLLQPKGTCGAREIEDTHSLGLEQPVRGVAKYYCEPN